MLKAISTSVLFGLLATSLPTLADESRHWSKGTVTNDRKAEVFSYQNKHGHQKTIKHAHKHSNAPKKMAFKKHHSYQSTYSHTRNDDHHNDYGNHSPRSAYYQGSHKHKRVSHLKRHHVLPKQLRYSRLPRRIESRLGHLPAHLMRVRVGNEIAVIHIKNRVVHEIIRGLF